MSKVQILSDGGQPAGDLLRDKSNGLRAAYGDELADVVAVCEAAADMVDQAMLAIDADIASGAYTPAGLTARRRVHVEPLAIESARVSQLAGRVERQLERTLEQAWDDLHRPATNVVEMLERLELQRRLERLDALGRQQELLAAVRTGEHDALLRAALAYQGPVLGIFDAWPHLLSEEVERSIKKALQEGLGLNSVDVWRVSELRALAAYLVEVVESGSPTTIIG